MQILLGENKPLWVALVPGPQNICFGVFVKFDELWRHSRAMPSKSLLKKVPYLTPDGHASEHGLFTCITSVNLYLASSKATEENAVMGSNCYQAVAPSGRVLV